MKNDQFTKTNVDIDSETEAQIREALHAKAETVAPRNDWNRVVTDLAESSGSKRKVRLPRRQVFGVSVVGAIGATVLAGSIIFGGLTLIGEDGDNSIGVKTTPGGQASENVPSNGQRLITEPQQLFVDDSLTELARYTEDLGYVYSSKTTIFDDPRTDAPSDLIVAVMSGEGSGGSTYTSGLGESDSKKVTVQGHAGFAYQVMYETPETTVFWYDEARSEDVFISSRILSEKEVVAAANDFVFNEDGSPGFDSSPFENLATVPFVPLAGPDSTVKITEYELSAGPNPQPLLFTHVWAGSMEDLAMVMDHFGVVRPTTVRGVPGYEVTSGIEIPEDMKGQTWEHGSLFWEESPGVTVILSSDSSLPYTLDEVANSLKATE